MLPFIKRQHRDPYGDWWDKQERRNFGEPVHEDDDIMGMLTTHDYNHVSPARGFLWFGTFWLVFAAGIGVVYRYYPDKPYVERTFPGGLDKELGGKNALVVSRISAVLVSEADPCVGTFGRAIVIGGPRNLVVHDQ